MNQKGMILPIMILITSFMLLTASYFFSNNVFSFSLFNNQYQQVLHAHGAQLALNKVINEISENESIQCKIPFQNNSKFVNESLAWWKAHGCHEKEIYYVYMSINEAPCDFLNGQQVEYTEIIIRAGDKRKSILGAFVALPSAKPMTCTSAHHELSKSLLGLFLL